MNKTGLLSIFLASLFIAFFGSLFGQSANGHAQEAEARTPDVSFEVVEHRAVEYPEFRIKIKNLSQETIYLLDFVSQYSLPEFFDWSIAPKYDFGMMEMAEVDSKEKDHIIELAPGQVTHIDFVIDQSFYPAEPDEVDEVEVTISYRFDPNDLEDALRWYPKEQGYFEGPTQAEIRPHLEKLTPLKLEAKPVRIKVPKPDK